MDNNENVLGPLAAIRQRMAHACQRAGREEEEVKLLLATKTIPVERILPFIEAGKVGIIGENKVMEARDKHLKLVDQQLQWHMIGHLQTNKIKYALKFADVIQSVDRLKLANKLQERCKFDGREVDVYIQVNTSFEESKFGVPPSKALELIKQVSELDRLHIKGLMTIGLLSSRDDKVRDCFKRLKEIQHLAKDLKLPIASFEELSMGMSNDFEMAIEEGSTIVRVGTALFGKREHPDSYYWNEN